MFPRHYVRVPHCSLCGQRFDSISAFRSVISNDDLDCDPAVTRSIVFQDDCRTIYLEDLHILIHEYPRKKGRYAPSVHSLCHTVGMDLLSPRYIYDSGLAMIPLICTELPREIYRHNPLADAANSLRETPRLDEGETILWRLLKRCETLPSELNMMIWDLLAPGPVRCLLALNANKRIWSYTPRSVGTATISFDGDIVIFFTRFFKGKYVCGIRQGHTLCGHESSSFANVRMPTSTTVCVFSLGIYGLQNIEFLTETETNFATKGDSVRDGKKFVRVIPCRREKPVCVDVEWDVWKISLIVPHDKSTFGHDFGWVPPFPCDQLCWLSPKRFYDWPRHFDFATQSQRIMAYVPLLGDKTLYGLTAFCSNEGFVGLGTHFHSHSASGGQDSSVYWYGKQHGYPIHIQLGCFETIRSIYVYRHTFDSLPGIYLAIRTIRNRVFILGPRFSCLNTIVRDIHDSDHGDILGLYYDASPGIRWFTSLGALCRPNSSSVSQTHDLSIPQLLANFDMTCPLSTSPFTSFLSEALLQNIDSIKLCHANSRCTGMLIYYKDDSRCTLGQWYENTHVQPDIQTITLPNDGFLRFYFARNDRTQLVTQVKALTGVAPNETGVMFIDVAYGDTIKWAFSGDTDIISRGPG